MTEMASQLQHADVIEDLKGQLAARVNGVIDMMTNFDEELKAPLLCRTRFEFSGDPKEPDTCQIPATFDKTVKRTAEMYRGLMTDIYNKLVPPRDDPAASMEYPWTFSGLDFSRCIRFGQGSSDELHVNSLMIVPRSQEYRFKDFFSQVFSRSGFTSRGLTLEDMQVQEIENSKVDVGMAVEHILKFVASWPPIVDRDDVNMFVLMFAYLDLSR